MEKGINEICNGRNFRRTFKLKWNYKWRISKFKKKIKNRKKNRKKIEKNSKRNRKWNGKKKSKMKYFNVRVLFSCYNFSNNFLQKWKFLLKVLYLTFSLIQPKTMHHFYLQKKKVLDCFFLIHFFECLKE